MASIWTGLAFMHGHIVNVATARQLGSASADLSHSASTQRRAAMPNGWFARVSGEHATSIDSPAAVVQRQLDAYNAHDLDAWTATYAENAVQFEHPGKLLAAGREALRDRMAVRFAERSLHATLLKRSVIGHIVIDHEKITKTSKTGPVAASLICIYEVCEGLIQTASFVFGASATTQPVTVTTLRHVAPR